MQPGKKKEKNKPLHQWRNRTSHPPHSFQEKEEELDDVQTLFSCFKFSITDEILEMLVNQTNLYSKQKKGPCASGAFGNNYRLTVGMKKKLM